MTFAEIYDAVEIQPLHLWARKLKKPDPIMEAVQLLLRLRSTYENFATNLENAIEVRGFEVASRTGVPLEVIKRIVRARAYDSDESEASGTIESDNNQRRRIVLAADSLLAIDRVSEAATQYRETVAVYREVIVRLRKLTEGDSEAGLED